MASRRLAAALILAGCSSGGGSDDDSVKPLPAQAVLCQVWAGNGIEPGGNAMRGVPGFGSLSTDVIAAWGEPSERNGNVWTYEWDRGSATLTFKQRELCHDGGKRIGGLWLESIEVDGIAKPSCWNYDRREDEATCDGCFDHGEVGQCL